MGIYNLNILFNKPSNIKEVKSHLRKYDDVINANFIKELIGATRGEILDESESLRCLVAGTLVTVPVTYNELNKVVIEVSLDGTVFILGRGYAHLNRDTYRRFLSSIGSPTYLKSLVWTVIQYRNTELLYPKLTRLQKFKFWITGASSKRDHIINVLGSELIHRSPPTYIQFISGGEVAATLANEELYQYYNSGIITTEEYCNLVYSLKSTYFNSPNLVVTL